MPKKPAKRRTKSRPVESTRVVFIGTGFVGSTAAFATMIQGIASEIVLIDINKKKSLGEALDLEHGLSFTYPCKIWSGSYKDCHNADVIVITAGLGQKPGQTRLELAGINAKIIADIMKNIRRYTKDAIIVMVTNPLDVMTYVAIKKSGFPKNRVFGTGTTLDSSRFRELLAEQFGVSPNSMQAYLIGEHGDSSVPVFSHANVMGEPIKNLPFYNAGAAKKAYEKTKNAAYEIIAKKGATYYAIALGISKVVRSIIYDENYVFPVSTLLTGQYGLRNVCLSLPAVVGRTGIKRVLDIKLDADERKQLKRSATIIKKTISSALKK